MKIKSAKIDTENFRAREGDKIALPKWPTRIKPICASKADYRAMQAAQTAQLSKLQDLLYADNRYALLVLFQAMDAAGKDGTIKHVMSGVNPQGCQVFGFKRPSAEELQHDFLWRTTRDLPERGRIGIFNRSYYEEVLVLRVHPEMLQGEGLAPTVGANKAFWQDRYRSITEQEEHLHRNNTRVVKIFLHLSKEEQRKRFLARIDAPEKNWKFSASDIAERKFWADYMTAYEKCISATSATAAPWYIVPADNKDDARLIVSQILLDTLTSMNLAYPTVSDARRKELAAIRVQLAKEAL